MESKKTLKADVDKRRLTFILIGIIVTLGLTITAFQWTTYAKKDYDFSSNLDLTEEEEISDITKQEKKPPPKTPPPEIEIVADDEEIEEDQAEIEDVEIDEDVAIEIPDPIIEVEEEEEVEEIVPFYAVEHKPEYPGGEKAMLEYLTKKIIYPEIEKENGIQGLVVVSFIVNTNGSISNVQIQKGVTPNINKEAIRVVKTMPRWKPGKQRNKPVKVPVNLPIRFTLAY